MNFITLAVLLALSPGMFIKKARRIANTDGSSWPIPHKSPHNHCAKRQGLSLLYVSHLATSASFI